MSNNSSSQSELENILYHQQCLLRPINIEKLNTITQGNIELSISLLKIFKEQAILYISDLEQASRATDNRLKKMFEAIHAVKGAVLCIGAEKAIELTKELQNQIIQDNKVDEKNYNNLLIEVKKIFNFISMIEVKKEFLSD